MFTISDLVEDPERFRYRPDFIPSPNSCQACGEEKRSHGLSHSSERGYHSWVEPTNELRLKRMQARRERRAMTR